MRYAVRSGPCIARNGSAERRRLRPPQGCCGIQVCFGALLPSFGGGDAPVNFVCELEAPRKPPLTQHFFSIKWAGGLCLRSPIPAPIAVHGCTTAPPPCMPHTPPPREPRFASQLPTNKILPLSYTPVFWFLFLVLKRRSRRANGWQQPWDRTDATMRVSSFASLPALAVRHAARLLCPDNRFFAGGGLCTSVRVWHANGGD